MKYINREYKGTYGYLKKQLIFEIIKTVILFAMALGIFFIGYLTLHTKRSLWSVLAVLALLPASKSLVGVIMLARFKSLSQEEYDLFSQAAGNVPVLYETVMTTSERAYFLPVMIYAANTLTVYVGTPNTDLRSLKEHMERILQTGGHSAAVRLFDDKDAFCARVREISAKSRDENTQRTEGIFNTIRAVSL